MNESVTVRITERDPRSSAAWLPRRWAGYDSVVSDTRRNPNGTWAKGPCGNPGGIPGGGGSRMAHVRRLNEAVERGNLTVSALRKIARSDKNANKRAAASHILTQIIKDDDDASMIRERSRLAADLDDRIEGKPITRMQVDQRVLLQRISAAPGDDRTAAEIAEEIRSLMFPPADDAASALPPVVETREVVDE